MTDLATVMENAVTAVLDHRGQMYRRLHRASPSQWNIKPKTERADVPLMLKRRYLISLRFTAPERCTSITTAVKCPILSEINLKSHFWFCSHSEDCHLG